MDFSDLITAAIVTVTGLLTGLLAGGGLRLFLKGAILRRISHGLAAAGWIVFFGGLAFWHLWVVPELDGKVGAGVGFGHAFVHVGGILFALFFTGAAAGVATVAGVRPVGTPEGR